MPGDGTENTHKDISYSSKSVNFREIAIYFSLFSPALYFGGIRYELILLIQTFLLSAFLIDYLRGSISVYLSTQENKWFFVSLFLLSIWILIRSLQWDDFFDGISSFLSFITGILLFYTTYSLPSTRERRKRSLLVIIIGVFFISIPHFFISFLQIPPKLPSIYFLYHAFQYHGYVILVIGMGLVLQFTIRNKLYTTLILIINTFLILSLIYFKKSAGVIAFFLVIFALFSFLAIRKTTTNKIILLFIIFLLLFNLVLFIGPYLIVSEMETLTPVSGYHAFDRWKLIYRETLEMIKDNFVIGVGMGKYFYSFPYYRNSNVNGTPRYAHSEPLHIFAETGLIGFILGIITFIFFIKSFSFSYFKSSWQYIDNRNQILFNPNVIIAIGGWAGIIGFLFISFVDFELHIPANAFLFCYIAAELLALGKVKDNIISHKNKGLTSKRIKVQPIKVLILSLLLSIIFIHNYFFIISSYYMNAAKKIRKQDESKAVEMLSNSISYYPLRADAYYNRGLLYQGFGKNWLSKSLDDFKDATIRANRNGTYITQLGLCQEKLERFQKSLASFNRAAKYDPKNVWILKNRAELNYKLNNIQATMQDFSKIISIDEAMLPKILIFFREHQINLDLLSSLIPENENLKIKFIEFLFNEKKYNHFFIEAKRFLNIKSITQKNLFKVAKLLQKTEQKDLAVKYYNKIFKNFSLDYNIKENKRILKQFIKLLNSMKKDQTAETFLLKKIKLHKTAPILYCLLAKQYENEKAFDKRETIIRRGINLNPESYELYFELGRFWLQKRKFLTAIQCYKLAWLKSSDDKFYGYVLAGLYFSRNMVAKASLILDKILKDNPDYLPALELKRRIFQKLNLKKEELVICTKILKLRPKQKTIEQRQLKLLSELKK